MPKISTSELIKDNVITKISDSYKLLLEVLATEPIDKDKIIAATVSLCKANEILAQIAGTFEAYPHHNIGWEIEKSKGK